MSTHSTTVGRIEFTDKNKYEETVRDLQESHLPVKQHHVNTIVNTQTVGDAITYGVEITNDEQRYVIRVPKRQYRNITYYYDELTEHATDWVLISGISDGVCIGRIDTPKNTVNVDLRNWSEDTNTRQETVPNTHKQITRKRVNELKNKFMDLQAEEHNITTLCK
jgi:hypothetical protein